MTPAQLKAIRNRLNMTQVQFAAALGFRGGQTHISRLERGLVEITPQTALLARYLDRHGQLTPARYLERKTPIGTYSSRDAEKP